MITIRSDDESGRSDKENGNANRQRPTWQVRFNKLEKFKEAHGHVDPNSADMKKKRPGLSQFIKNQLKKDQKGKLDKTKRDKLEALGVDFTVDGVAAALENDWCKIEKGDVTKEGSGTVKKDTWKTKYAALVKFHKENGTCDVPADHPLAKWVQLQKRRFVKLQKNHPEKVKKLNELGFDWGKSSATTTMTLSEKKKHHNGLFQKKLARLIAFKDEHGHCDVPLDHPVLGRWVKSLRARYASGGLQKNHPEKVEKLNELGIDWEKKDDTTSVDGTTVSMSGSKQRHQELVPKKLALLRDFKDEHGNCNVPKSHPKLGRWANFLRARYASGELKKNNTSLVDKLDTLGFEWDANDASGKSRHSSFDEKFDLLCAFKDEHGHCNVPADHPELGQWVKSLHARYASGGLQKNHPEKVEKLNELGIEWKKKNDTTSDNGAVSMSDSKQRHQELFLKNLALLRAFKDEHGHCDVPLDHPELGRWVKSLRTRYESGVLQKNHPKVVDKLTALGFVWNHQEDTVTTTSVGNTTLGRNLVRKNRDNPDRGNGWGKKLKMLKEYKKKTGNSIPPEDHDLGPWVRDVKRKYGMIQKHFPELLEDSGDATSSLPSSSSSSGDDGMPKSKKSLPLAKVY